MSCGARIASLLWRTHSCVQRRHSCRRCSTGIPACVPGGSSGATWGRLVACLERRRSVGFTRDALVPLLHRETFTTSANGEAAGTFINPARSRARDGSALLMNHDQTRPFRRFSALNKAMPASIPITQFPHAGYRSPRGSCSSASSQRIGRRRTTLRYKC